ncbi:MAG: malto-oligosyltrehalose synthase, partial [Bryobacterales bacterium]|nr:malto-oligosyltrehalose synthase [Bryobacterales bacterium]
MTKPSATYRLQFHAGFGFDAAAEVADYLKALGISHVYSSPYLQAAPGSTHGYDVVDHRRVNDELGGAEAHERFTAKLRELGLGQVLDIVPNHMSIAGRDNAWWWDVLENGPASIYASYFDIDWQGPEERLRNKVMVPVLGDHYGRVLAAGQIRAIRENGSFVFRYYEHTLPVAPRSMCKLLTSAAERAGSDYLAFLATALHNLPGSTVPDRASQLARHRDKEVIRSLLARLCAEHRRIADAIDACVSTLNEDIDALDALLEVQNYRLSFWRTSERELGYRRFFDVNTLVGLRAENPQVFADTHVLPLEWVRRGALDGLRVDHPDGLRDPEQYFERLAEAAPNAWIVGEKILEPGERLRPWQVAGTTGYDFLNVLGGLFIDQGGEAALTAFYEEFTGDKSQFSELALEKKHQVLREILGSDVNRLTAQFMDICERHRNNRDFTRHEIHHALREVVACFPVYRTYVRAEAGQVTAEDRRYVDAAVTTAKARRPDLDSELFDFLHSVLLLKTRGALESEFVMQFQQFTGPAMAKGVEDTAFYCYNRLVSLNEVGGDPGRFGVSLDEFHTYCMETQRDRPATMLATSTHDTKRSEDVRARISLLSEIPEDWAAAVRRWSEHNERYKRDGWPDRNTEYLLYQTLVGAWPIGVERLLAYMRKAAREAKRHTSWTTVNQAFETAVQSFVEGLLGDPEFMAEFERFVGPLIEPGRGQALSQVLVKITAPGVPDIYQGTELWDLSLVDPDNRRPVDYAARRRLLDELDALTPEQILARGDEGLPKLWTIRQALRIRERLGDYARIPVGGEKCDHVIAFQRGEVI